MKLTSFTTAELQNLCSHSNFTKDELASFELLAKGKTLYEISRKLNVSERTASRRIHDVKSKIIRVIQQEGVLK